MILVLYSNAPCCRENSSIPALPLSWNFVKLSAFVCVPLDALTWKLILFCKPLPYDTSSFLNKLIIVDLHLLQDLTVIFRRRGGDDLEQSHSKWAETVPMAPDVINMTFVPIVSLLDGVPGIKHLNRAIDLYLQCKFQWYINEICLVVKFLYHSISKLTMN